MQQKQELAKNPQSMFKNKLPVVDTRDKAHRYIFILAIAWMIAERIEIPFTRVILTLATLALLGKYHFDRKQLAVDFREAAQKGNLAKLIEIFEKLGPQMIDATSSNGKSALHWAARYKQNEAVRFLLKNGADINRQDNEGNTPVHDALYFEKGKKIPSTFTTIALMVATQEQFKGMFAEKPVPNDKIDSTIKNNKNETASDLLKKLEGSNTNPDYLKAVSCLTQLQDKKLKQQQPDVVVELENKFQPPTK